MALPRRSAIIFSAGVWFAGLFLPSARALDLQGNIQIKPPYPQPSRIEGTAKQGVRVPSNLASQSLLVSAQGGVQNALVFLLDPPGTRPAPKGVAVLDQKDYYFQPHVLLVFPGQSFWIKNSDPEAHDVRGFDGPRMLFRFEIKPGAEPVEERWDRPGIYVIRCGVHRWMNAYVVQAAHAFYAVTGQDGEFRLQDIPGGRYTLRIWHESLGQTDVPVEIKDSVSHFTYTFANQGV